MNCIICDLDAQYVLVYSIPVTGIAFISAGGSYCAKHFAAAKKNRDAVMKEWINLFEKIEKKEKERKQ